MHIYMGKYLFNMPDRQQDALRSVSAQTQLSVAEVLRKILDRNLTSDQLNETFPSLSGSLTPKAQ